MNSIQPSSCLGSELAAFFDDFSKTRGGLPALLASFLTEYADVRRIQIISHESQRQGINCEQLTNWLLALKKPLEVNRAAAWRFDPWKVVGLGRDEVRNSRILAWILGPNETHDLGDRVLNDLREAINSKLTGSFLPNPDRYCFVMTESNPSGEIADRVDIEIDADTFYLIIEVKIDALEGGRQIERYCDVANQRAGSRPWAVVFLTPKGKEADTAAHYGQSGRIVPMSWCALARIIKSSLSTSGAQQNSPQQAATHAIHCFVKTMTTF